MKKDCLAVVSAIGNLGPYFYGHEFTVGNDHHALCWLKSLKNVSGRLGRWTLHLQDYYLVVTYKSEKWRQDADGLSRCSLPLEMTYETDDGVLKPNAWTPQDLSVSQRMDPRSNNIIHQIFNSTGVNFKVKLRHKVRDYKVENNLLYKRSYVRDGDHWLVVVPRHHRQDVPEAYCNHSTGGPLGVHETHCRFRLRYLEPGVCRDAQKYVKSCRPCQRYKSSVHKASGLLVPLPCPERLFERVGID